MGTIDYNVIALFVNAALEIWQRHFHATGEKLTNEQVNAQLKSEIAAGKHEIVALLAEKGVTVQ